MKWHWLVGPSCKYISKYRYLTDLGKARWCSTNIFVIHSITHNVRHPLPPLAFRRPRAQTVEDGTLSHIADYFAQAYCILKLQWFWWIGGFCILVKFCPGHSATATRTAGFLNLRMTCIAKWWRLPFGMNKLLTF